MKYFIDTEFLEGSQRLRRTFLEALLATKIHTQPTIDLISIGIVAEDGREYYAISKDFNLNEAWNRFQLKKADYHPNGMEPAPMIKEYWIRDNVLKPIYLELLEKEFGYGYSRHEFYTSSAFVVTDKDYKQFKYLINKYGKTNKKIAEEILDFINTIDTLVHKPYNSLQKNIVFTDIIEKYGKPEFYGYYSDYDWVVFCWLFGKMIDLPKGFPIYCIDLKQTLDEKAWSTYCNNGTLNSETSLEERIKYLKGESNNHLIKPNKPKFPKQINEHNALADARWNFQLYQFLNQL